MKSWLRDFFTFSALERKGIMLLIALILMIYLFNLRLVHRRSAQDLPAREMLARELQWFEQQLTWVSDSQDSREKDTRAWNGKTYERYYRKPYGRSASQNHTYPAQGAATKPMVLPIPADLNAADSAELERLPGIGPVLARRIIRYRKLLGGFYDTRQLMEVYGISDSVYLLIAHRVAADTASLVRINLNEAPESVLARHPYIGRYMARGIILYRAQTIRIGSLEELIINGIMTSQDRVRLAYYLRI